jgi:hypothetical protein
MVNKKIFALLALLTTLFLNNLAAKDHDFCTWIDLTAVKKYHAATFGLVGEIYTKQNSSTLERVSLGVKGDYSIYHWLSAGAGFLFMEFKHPGEYELRKRFYFQVEPSWQHANLAFSFRERVQITQYPESPMNLPASKLWRNRFEVCYKDHNWRLEPLINLETLYLLEQFNLGNFTEMRYSVGANYHLTANQKIKFYGLFTESTILNRFIIGVFYELKL